MPDIENLKTLSRLLSVSVDNLLDDSAEAVIREPCHLAAYGRGCSKVKKDRLMQERFSGAKICTLLGRPELTEEDSVVDRTRGFLTPVPFGSPEFMKSIRNLDRDFYLVELEDDQFFVTVTDDYLEIRPLLPKQTGSTFHLGSWSFIRGNDLPEA